MEERISIDYKNKKAGYQELIHLIDETRNSQIVIQNIIINRESLEQLDLKYADKLIYYIEWSKILIIENSISTDFVMSNIDLFIQCFIEFDITAYDLIELLAKTYNIDLNDPAQIWDLKRNKSKNQSGQINSTWAYHFHGAECAFTNRKTGQNVEIKIIYGQEYGVIDNFFLFRFIETTKSLAFQFEFTGRKKKLI